MWEASDEALVAGLSTGDPEVASVFVRRFEARVYGLALSITGDRFAAEDVAQETFVRAWRYAASYDPRRGPTAAWLLSIARNAALDYIRGRGRRLDVPAPDSIAALAESVGAGSVVSPHEELSEIASALGELPAEQRETLLAVAYYGYTTREISDAWRVPQGTVKTRLRLAIHKLRDVLSEVSP